MNLHRFLWQNSEDEELQEYAVTLVHIGDKPAGCIAQLVIHETADLPSFSHLEEERRLLHVDDILMSHKDFQQLKYIVANVELISKAGGFLLKPWVFLALWNQRKKSWFYQTKCTVMTTKHLAWTMT